MEATKALNPLDEAKRLNSLTTPEEKLEGIKNAFSKPDNYGIKVCYNLLQLYKDATKSSIKNSESFLGICNSASETLNEYMKKENLSKDEREDLSNKLMQIVKMAEDDTKNQNIQNVKTKRTAYITAGVTAGFITLPFIIKTISNILKKN